MTRILVKDLGIVWNKGTKEDDKYVQSYELKNQPCWISDINKNKAVQSCSTRSMLWIEDSRQSSEFYNIHLVPLYQTLPTMLWKYHHLKLFMIAYGIQCYLVGILRGHCTDLLKRIKTKIDISMVISTQ